MDLSMDFADFSSPDGKVVEVRNTFLHVRNPNESNSGAASRSDFVCNYSEYPELAQEQVPEDLVIATRSKNRRPGKKARARMMRRLSTLSSISSISTEAPADPQSNGETSGLPTEVLPDAHSDHTSSQTLSEAPSSDDTSTLGESLPLSVMSLVDDFVDDCLSMTLSDVASMTPPALAPTGDNSLRTSVVADGDDSFSRATSSESIQTASRTESLLSAPSVASDNVTPRAMPDERTSKGGLTRIIGAFAFGVLFAIASFALLWSTNAVQIRFASTTEDHHTEVAQKALESFKEQAEKRLATQERMLQDILAKMQTAQAAQDGDREVTEVSKSKASGGIERVAAPSVSANVPQTHEQVFQVSDVLSSPSNSTSTMSSIALLLSKPDVLSGSSFEGAGDLLDGSKKLDIGTALPHQAASEAARGWWINTRLACAVWFGLVLICSMFQTFFLRSLPELCEKSTAELDVQKLEQW